MREEIVSLLECKPGDIISREVIDVRTGIVLCNAGHTLTEESIHWLKKFLCSEIYVKRNTWEYVWNLTEESIEVYEANKNRVEQVLYELKERQILDRKKLKEVEDSFRDKLSSNTTIMGCINIIKSIDEYLYAHSMNVGMLSVLIGRWLKLDASELEELFLAGMLHDAGKYKVAPEIVNKRGELTLAEWSVAKKHVLYGYDLLKDSVDISAAVKVAVLTHHERIDGSGYPKALKEEAIPLYGKIVAVADVYDAMLSEKVYKDRKTPFVVMEEMMKDEFGKLDTKVLLTFLKHIADYYVGVYVKLSTGAIGEVVFIHSHCVYRPIIKVDDTYIDLDTQRSIKIIEII